VAGRAALLVEQRHHEVGRLDEGMIPAERQRLGIGQRQLEFGRQLVHSHGVAPLKLV
jgi:hypothetical protein